MDSAANNRAEMPVDTDSQTKKQKSQRKATTADESTFKMAGAGIGGKHPFVKVEWQAEKYAGMNTKDKGEQKAKACMPTAPVDEIEEREDADTIAAANMQSLLQTVAVSMGKMDAVKLHPGASASQVTVEALPIPVAYELFREAVEVDRATRMANEEAQSTQIGAVFAGMQARSAELKASVAEILKPQIHRVSIMNSGPLPPGPLPSTWNGDLEIAERVLKSQRARSNLEPAQVIIVQALREQREQFLAKLKATQHEYNAKWWKELLIINKGHAEWLFSCWRSGYFPPAMGSRVADVEDVERLRKRGWSPLGDEEE
ncbi:hypothetical protein FA95DRAFT_1684133 [Auriscalpium vulgare]|uniref:Uncharacterized protein n=1 Tax=Auriscalpium vulgare TaxID=40419 RepID=A0ACB8R6N4_9AGAM|nr:hypothetical protein FA95DRAFT_1684133 [Auriscalpium vulgare]